MDEHGYITLKRNKKTTPFILEQDGSAFQTMYQPWTDRNGSSAYSSQDIPSFQQQTYSFRSGPSYGLTQNPVDLLNEASSKFQRPYDNGHEFTTENESFKCTHESFRGAGNGLSSVFGPIIDREAFSFIGGSSFDTRYHFGGIDLGQGTKFLSQSRPLKSGANVAQALLELLVDLPRIPFDEMSRLQSKLKYLKRGSAEYLNIVFAWQPLVGDVLKICKAIVNSTKIIQQYERDSGKQIRRTAPPPNYPVGFDSTVVYPSKDGIATTASTGDLSYLFNSPSDALGTSTLSVTTTEKYWFSGAYTYLSTTDKTFLGKMAGYGRLANQVLGTRIDILTLWQIAPWSWLSDWFSDIGAIIDVNNAMAQDNLVISYGYLMRKSSVKYVWDHTGITFAKSGPTGPLRSTYLRTKKERVRATPYGFGFNLDSLNENQWAILIALGLTKGDKKFWWG